MNNRLTLFVARVLNESLIVNLITKVREEAP
jgi:hypothetical protein